MAALRCSERPILKNQEIRAAIPYKGDKKPYQTPFEDKQGGDGVFIDPQSLLRMWVEKAEAAWSAIRFKAR